MKQLKKANARIAELEADLKCRICGDCKSNLITNYHYNSCHDCVMKLCDDCGSVNDKDEYRCLGCVEILPECASCQSKISINIEKCNMCSQIMCYDCMIDMPVCEWCLDNAHLVHEEKECPACGEDVCFECSRLIQRVGYKGCCVVSEDHVHCPECEVIYDSLN